MLLIGDIHITWSKKDAILHMLHEKIFASSETSILFLWDYVYHFNYDRKALMWLFDLFVSCFEAWKDVYILAWNHDRIWWHFVYAEAQKAFSYVASKQGSLEFITSPVRRTIEWQECLFFPYHIPDPSTHIVPEFEDLSTSQHQKEQRSARANSLLTTMISDWKSQKTSPVLRVFHHWYMVGTSFPWQFARFSYKSPWLSDVFFEDEDIMLCSWHLHQPFCYKNYLCLWSVRHTSPLEIDQTKYLFTLDTKTQKIQASSSYINPYYHIPVQEKTKITLWDIHTHIEKVSAESEKYLMDGSADVSVQEHQPMPSEKICHLTLVGELTYRELDEVIESDVFHSLSDVRIKQSKRPLPQVLELLDTQSQELDSRISWWKSLLESYLHQKYWKDAERYISELEWLWVKL